VDSNFVTVSTHNTHTQVEMRPTVGGDLRPQLPRIAAGDRVVAIILTDLETIKKAKGKKKLENSQYLIHYISQQLRKSTAADSLLQTTAIWALINIFRSNPEDTRPILIQAGIPGVLLDIMRMGLSGVSRQYASELCFFLRSAFFFDIFHSDQ
jgi:hypothetical protein